MRADWAKAWHKELDDFLRAFSGAFLFGVPMLFTLEMWQIGSYLTHGNLLLLLGMALAVNFPLSYFAGFKGESTFRVGLDQAVGALAVGTVSSAIVLVILNRIQPGDSLDSILGQIIVQAVPLSLGASVANALLKRSEQSREERSNSNPAWRALLNDLGATAAGGVFIGFSIAPTEEVLLLALEMSYWHELALIGFSLLTTYIIVFESGFSPNLGFSPQFREANQPGFLQRPVTETMVSYVLSLLVAGLALYLLGQIEIGDPLNSVLSRMIVLGFPTAIGGAAGRLVI